MKFLLFNLAVVAALIYLFSAGGSGLGLGGDQGEDPLQALRQELESLAQDVAEDRQNTEAAAPRSLAAEMPKEVVQAPESEKPDPVSEEPSGHAAPAASAAPEPAPAKPSAEPDPAQPELAAAPAQTPKTLEDEPKQNGPIPLAASSLPQVDDPAVAQRRAEVLDGVALFDGAPGETSVKAGPPMTPDERLRRLYSLAEEMELLYVRKVSR